MRRFKQLRKRFSIQRAFRCNKYYPSVALGLLDCAITNAYLVHRDDCAQWGRKAMDHGDFLAVLHAQLLQVTPHDLEMTNEEPRSASPASRHIPVIVSHPGPAASGFSHATTTRGTTVHASAVAADPRRPSVPRRSLRHGIHGIALPRAHQRLDFQVGEFGRKRMARGCKVGSSLAASGSRGANHTKWTCPECSKHHDGEYVAS